MGPGVLHKLRHQIVGINDLTGSVEGWFAGESAAYGTFRYGIGSLPDQWLIERPLHRCARRRQGSVRNLWNRGKERPVKPSPNSIEMRRRDRSAS